MSNKNSLSALLKITRSNLNRAKEEYLFARGWIKLGKGHFTPEKNKKISAYIHGDKMFLNEAMRVQEEVDRGIGVDK